MKHLDLFSGIGGFALPHGGRGLRRLRFVRSKSSRERCWRNLLRGAILRLSFKRDL